MSLQIFNDIEQGTDEWFALRCGVITASVVGLLITAKTIKPASNDTSRGLTAQLVAERITGHVEPMHETHDMLRGTLDEPFARDVYAEHYAPVTETGFMVRKFDGFRIGFSPDGLVGDSGLIEIKSRKQKIQLRTIIEDAVPLENMAQIQCGLLVSGREWCDYVSYSGGMPLWTKRILPDERWLDAITDAVLVFEATAAEMIAAYNAATEHLPTTERLDHFAEMEIF